jgi:probable addiction module antidote protein
MTLETIPYDSVAHFGDAEGQAELLRDALASGDTGYIKHALGIVARARGMTQMERDTGIKRQALYRALGQEGNPTLDTLMSIIKALRLKLTVIRDEFLVEPATNGRYAVARRTLRSPAPLTINGATMLYGVFKSRASAYRWVAALESSPLPRPTRGVERERQAAIGQRTAA